VSKEKAKDYKEIINKEEKPSISEVLENIKVQHSEHLKKAEYHNTMAIKAQGAIEILSQLEEGED
tara:strand:+ start:144 stop:338 length:195 start_codon:yes stop_codon:yes gene_type:complete